MAIATPNCQPIRDEGQGNTCLQVRNRVAPMACLAFCLLCIQVLASEVVTNTERRSAEQLAKEFYRSATLRFQQDSTNAETALQAGKACFDLAEFARRKSDRAKLADQGMAACRRSLALQSNSASAQYYLAMNLGQLARTKGWGALKLVRELERIFLIAVALDPMVDYAGSHRNLGYLYRDTPSFSVGDLEKARHHLELAVSLVSDYPENRIALAEGMLKWDDRKGAREQVKLLDDLWPKARQRFAGPNFEPAWADWEHRLQELKDHLKSNRGFLGLFPKNED